MNGIYSDGKRRLLEEKTNPQPTEEQPSSSVKSLEDAPSVESEKVASEVLMEFAMVADSRRKLRETEEELRMMFSELNRKLDSLADLKKENMALEREVLTKIRARI